MRKDKRRGMAAFLAAVLVAALCLCQAAFAAESAGIEEDGQSTLSIDLEGQEKRATLSLYAIGHWDGSQGAYVLDDAFAGSGIDLAELMDGDGMTTQEMEEACAALAAYARDNGIQALETKDTEGGKLQFMPVPNGFYLVAQTGDDSTFKVASFFTPLPLLEDGTWDYGVEAHPKNADVPAPPPTPTEPAARPDGGNGGGGGGGRRTYTVGGSATIGEGGTPLDTIEDGDTPLGPLLDTIQDTLTPLASLLPKTGDRSIAYLPLFLTFMASGAGILVLAGMRKRYRYG